ncbi:CST complex subunit CTC1 isoform X2 [Lolium perenne]|uniref:CST complex subunit CTC1 isoform X2 n=1 Tax=Lolium perenne TaxID=4522 RepID=UPI0021F611F5|nr:CST complex subunit CTC1 isoform X2 [Lolium perenne]
MEPPPEATAPRRLAVADLLLIRLPTTGASSLFSSSPSPPRATSTSQPRKKPKLSPPNPAPTTAPFAPIPHPVLLAGTLSLPPASCSDGCRNHCLSLADPSTAVSVCCYLLDFDPAAIGREILILAWNYLPSIRHNEAGVLEVVRWRLAEVSGPAPGPSFLTSILLNCVDAEPDPATRGRAFGVVTSVSVVFSVPHTAQKSKAGDLVGFIAEMMCCGCRQCKASQPESGQDHKFEVEKFVYFVDLTSRWRPVLARLIGRPVSVTGLRKKMVSVGKKGSYTMLVSSANTMVAWCPSYAGVPQSDELPGKCAGVYCGIVSGIYMHGMLVELDGIAWLLIDDKQLVPPHSLRIGAVISVKKLRLVRLKFAWTTVVLLGTCSKTSITINSFSLMDSKFHMRAENKGLSGKYLNSLDLSARFWTLLLTSCFKQKFKLGYEKEIWGSKNKQGLAHIYAAKVLSSRGFEPQHDVLVKFCNHNCDIKSSGSNLEACKLISSLPRRLQLVDDTGCIDIVVPDLPPNVCLDGIYEINDCKLALEGPVAYLDHYGVSDPLSCKAVFQNLSFRKKLHHLKIFVIVNWSELSRIGPSSEISSQTNNRGRLFHLLKLSHIFPAINNHQDTRGPSMYAEAMILPYNLKFTGQDDCIEHAESFRMSSTRSLCDSKVPMEKPCYIPCSLSFRTTSLSGTLVSSYSCGSDGTILIDTSCEEQGCPSRILLEFKEGRLLEYQLLRIGGYYLLECPSDSSSFAIKGCGCFQCSKISLDSQDKLWSLAISFNRNGNIKQGIVDQYTGEVDQPFSRNTFHNEIRLVQSWNNFHQHLDFLLKFYCEAVSGEMEEYNALCSVLNGLCSYSIEVITVSSCTDIMMREKPFGSSNLQSEKLVQGDLISLHGKVENIHSHDCKDRRLTPGNEAHNICIHLADDNQTVRLRGYLSKHCYPVGIGRGASVTFHRVLLTRHELLLTPVTYIQVTSISHTELNRERATSPLMPGGLKDSSLSTVLPCPILREKHFKDSRPMQFQCRVVTIHLLVLDSCLHDLQTSEAANKSKILAVQVPVAGFIVDNGTSLCCCWADDARAELLLRLQEIAALDASAGLKFSKDRKKANLQQTFGSCLLKMLKKHKNVIVKNYGIPPDTSCRDLELSSGIGHVLNSLEQKLLKFIILNACCKGTLNVIASALDPNAINASNVGFPDVYPVQNMQNFWINESFQVDPLEEARRLVTTLKNS